MKKSQVPGLMYLVELVMRGRIIVFILSNQLPMLQGTTPHLMEVERMEIILQWNGNGHTLHLIHLVHF